MYPAIHKCPPLMWHSTLWQFFHSWFCLQIMDECEASMGRWSKTTSECSYTQHKFRSSEPLIHTQNPTSFPFISEFLCKFIGCLVLGQHHLSVCPVSLKCMGLLNEPLDRKLGNWQQPAFLRSFCSSVKSFGFPDACHVSGSMRWSSS